MKKVMIDIGHGGSDTGAVANGLVEKDLNLKVGLLVKEILSEYEVDVRLTREKDIDLSPDKRVAIVNEFNPDLCVSIHHNATSSIARGAEVIHAHYDEFDDELATDILLRLAKAGMPTRRAFTKLNERGSDYYFMIRRIWDNDTEAIIIEGGFVTNSEDAKMLKTTKYIADEATAISNGIIKYLDLKLRKQSHWGDEYIEKLQEEKIIDSGHDSTAPVIWAEMAAVMCRVLERLEK